MNKKSEYDKKYHQENREKILARKRAKYAANKEEIKKRRKNSNIDREKLLARKKRYYKAHRERLLAKQTEIRKKKKLNLPNI